MKNFHLGVEKPERGFDRFVGAWERMEAGEMTEGETHLNFEDLSMLLSLLTPCRLDLLKTLRRHGPMSIRALAKKLERDYKNVHTDTRSLVAAGLIGRTQEGKLDAPWDVIDAHVRLVA